jgi:hypothetical protein
MHCKACALLALVLPMVLLVQGTAQNASQRSPRSAETRITDQEFWQLSNEFSEPEGFYPSDNLVSTELSFPAVMSDLVRMRPGGGYVGVGPEQNFHYIAALRPSVAFIVDIRRGNLQVHLMYKALFELADDRSDFLARLFTRARPTRLSSRASAGELMKYFLNAEGLDEAAYQKNLREIFNMLTVKHRWPLSPDDRAGIEWAYRAFYWHGPRIAWSRRPGVRATASPEYGDLMVRVDSSGVGRSYLATEANFAFVKSLHARNLIIPVVGDFAGPKALRAVGTYLTKRQTVVGAFYVSDVELTPARWNEFCANVAALPLDPTSVFIRNGPPDISLLPIAAQIKGCG